MRFSRRRTLGFLGSAVAFPYVLSSNRARAASIDMVGPPVRFDVGAELPGGISISRLAPLRGESAFMAGWLNSRSAQTVLPYVRYFSAAGTPLTEPTRIGGSNGPTDGNPSIQSVPLVLRDRTAFTFISGETNPSPLDLDAYAQRFGEDRAKIGVPQLIAGGPQWQASIQAVQMPTSDVLVVWQDTDGFSGTGNSAIRHRLMNRTGTQLAPARRTTPAAIGRGQIPTSLAALTNGNAVLAYVVFGESEFASARVQRLDASGMGVGQPTVLKTSQSLADACGGAAVAALPNGRAIVIYAKVAATAGVENLRCRFIEDDGAVGSERQITQIEGSRNRIWDAPLLAIEPGTGRIIVMLQREAGGGQWPQLFVLDQEGSALLGPVDLITGGPDIIATGDSLICMANGRFVAGYSDFSGTSSVASFQRFRIVD